MTDVLTPPVFERAEPAPPVTAPAGPPAPSRWRRVWRGPEHDPAWARPSLFVLLAATGVLYMWHLGDNGWANAYYSAAVQAGTQSWKAFFFGSLDAANSITVDKAPASLWVMELSARVFGVNSWSILAPQALEGVATVGVLYMTVKRWFSPGAALLAGAVVAVTPVAALMFRFNNPDALLVLLLVLGAYALTRALEHGNTWWLVTAFSFVGFGFLAKMLQALVVVPVFGVVYLLCGPPKLGRRIGQLVLGAVALLVSAGWWVAIVELWPKSARPYIGGSENNSVLNLIFGYNGFGRLNGEETGSVGGGPAGTGGRWGPTGWNRLFNTNWGAEASWLIPAALLLGAVVLIATLKRPRTDRTRAALLLWGGWLVVTGAVFSFGQGIIHEYYSVALAPAIGAVVAISAFQLWEQRDRFYARAALAAAVAITAWWSTQLLHRVPTWHPGLQSVVMIGGGAVAVALLVMPLMDRKILPFVGVTAIAVCLLASSAFALATANEPHSGAIPLSGPRRTAFAGGPPRIFRPQQVGPQPRQFGPPPQFGGGAPIAGANRGTLGGLLEGSEPSETLQALLAENADDYTWVAATTGANTAAGYQLATGKPVMALGGFNGTDPSPTLAQFQQYVAQGKIHYFIGSGGFGGVMRFGAFGGANANTSSEIARWVEQNFTSQTVGGATVYDLSGTTSAQ